VQTKPGKGGVSVTLLSPLQAISVGRVPCKQLFRPLPQGVSKYLILIYCFILCIT